MKNADFLQLLETVTTLNLQQKNILIAHLSNDSGEHGLPVLYQRLEQNFLTSPYCGHCHSKTVQRYGYQHGRQRYRCKSCGRTFNALTGTSLARLRVIHILDDYLECMTSSMTLRPSARKCGISLDTAFHLRHRIMELLQRDQAEQLQGIVELDETFFRESHKGSHHLIKPARKRGGMKKKPGKKRSSQLKPRPVKKIPVLVACDRQQNFVSEVLDHMWWEDIEACLVGRIPSGTPLCADALPQHDLVANHLGLIYKWLVTTEGQTVKEEVFHLQHVNAHHSTLKAWINGHFKGIATKYLSEYLGWRRALSTCELTLSRLIEKLAGHWLYQLQS